MERCVEEARSLALVRGVGLADNAVDATLGFIDGLAAGATTSLQRDIADGKPSELDYWNGAVVRLAEGNHVGVPTHELIYSLLSPLEQRSRGHLVARKEKFSSFFASSYTCAASLAAAALASVPAPGA